jgi:hypothetical protein
MASSWGARHGLPGYDRFRTGLTFGEVSQMLWTPSDDPRDWKRRSRGSVLGLWHSMKLALYEEAVARGYGENEEK